MNTTTTMAERYAQARGLFEHGEYQAAADSLRALVDESALEPPLHGTTELRVLLGRAYFHSAQLGRAPEARPHLAMAELLGGYAGTGRLTGRLTGDSPGASA